MTKRVKYNLTGLMGTVLLVAFDQWTKLLAIRHLMGQAAVPILDGVFELHYLENRGAAFGILQGQKGIFLLCTALVLVVLAFYYNRMPVTGRFRLLRLVGVLLSAGAVGNLIDRMQHSYVVDFLYFKLIDFPIFNVADCYVTAGAVLLAAAILFVYKEDELGFLSLRKQHE